MLKGLDVSCWQGAIDFSKVKTDRDFVVLKATEGVGFTDPKFSKNQIEARKAGLLLGYYCFSRPDLGNTVKAEVDYLIKIIGDLQEGEAIFLDYEVSYKKPVEWCKSWLDYLAEKLGGYKGLVYLNQSLLTSNDWSQVINAEYGLWLAKYDYTLPAKAPVTKWGTCAFQQYSNREAIPGVLSPCDADVFFGDEEAYRKYGYKVAANPCEEKIAELEKELEKMRESRNKWKKSYGESEKKNAGTIKELEKEKETNKALSEEKEILKTEIIKLNAKLIKNLRGYSKSELAKAYFGIFPK